MSMRLIDLLSLPDVAAVLDGFPRRIQPGPGLNATFPPGELLSWLTFLNNAVDVSDVQAGSDADGVTLQAKLSGTMAAGSYMNGFPFYIGTMPDVEFRIQDISSSAPARLFARATDAGAEVVVEDLLVEIGLPEGLLTPPDPAPGSSDVPEIEKSYGKAGSNPDALLVTLRRSGRTTIRTRVRIHMDQDGETTLRFAVPVSFGPCKMSGVPCRAVHDFRLIPSPSRAAEEIEWLRHDVTPFDADIHGINGSFAMRALDIDPESEALQSVARAINDDPETDPTAALVIEDLVVPFYSYWVLPIPRHITAGVRRDRVEPYDITKEFSFATAPVKARLSNSPDIQLILESFFYRSMPVEELDRDLGLTFKAGLVFGDKNAPPAGESDEIDHHTLLIELGDNYTLRVGYKREFDDTTGLPDATTGAGRFIDQLLSIKIENVSIDIMALRVGYAIGKAVADGASFGDCFECTIDLWVTMEPSEGGVIQFKALSGDHARFGITDLGWKQGAISVEGLKSPDGVEILIADVFSVFLEELGLVVREGATYFTITGGLGIKTSGDFEIKAGVKGLAVRIAGNPAARSPQIEGFFLKMKVPEVVEFDAAGYYVQKFVDPFDIRELGLSAKLSLTLGSNSYVGGFDLIIGNASNPAEQFDYFFGQLFFRGTIPIAFIECIGIRALLGRNMQPKLPSPSKDDLRYFKWYKSSDPIKVDASRRLSAWEPQNETWSWGVGLGASFTGCGAVGELGLFVMGVHGPDENGLLIVGELFLLGNPKPAGTLVIEWDGKEERFALMVGVSIKAKDFVDSAPDWLGDLVSVTGTLFASNKRAIFAIGRIADQKTWFRLVADIDFLLGKTYLEIGVAFEWSEGEDGAKGFGLIVRFNGGVNAGVIRLEYNLGLGILVVSFNNSSSDFAVGFWIEGGLRFVLFGFIRFGISAKAEFRVVGSDPSRGDITFRITFETPWFLPDITWSFQHAFGQLDTARLSVATGALRAAGARQALTSENSAVYAERLDPAWDGNAPPSTSSVTDIRARTPSETARLQNFADAELAPISTDSVVSIGFTGTVSDSLSLGPSDVSATQGKQSSGELQQNTRLVGIEIRRRPRFASAPTWSSIEERQELTVDFSDPSGTTLTGNIDQQTIQMSWDADVSVDEDTAAKRLLINSRTPFEFATTNPERDEEIVTSNPRWPCCPDRADRDDMLRHIIEFSAEAPGTQLKTPPAISRMYTDSLASLWLPRFTWARDAVGLASGTPPRVAAISVNRPGVVFVSYFDRAALAFVLRCFWTGPAVELVLRGYDREDRQVGEERYKLHNTGTRQSFAISTAQPMRRLTATLVGGNLNTDWPIHDPDLPDGKRYPALELERLVFVSMEDWIADATQTEGCNDGSDAFDRQYEGTGNVFWLPNHEYEVTIRTEVSIDHPQADVEIATLEEHVLFATKGLPGLNAVEEVGAEVRPYVRDAYNGGCGVLYREEPITLAFHEDFSIAVPLASRPAGAVGDEATQLFLMQLLAEPQAALGGAAPGTATSQDWIVANRSGFIPDLNTVFQFGTGFTETVATRFRSESVLMERLAGLTQRPQVTCGLDDPRDVVGPALIAHPEGAVDPDDPTKKLWPERTPIRAMVRREAAPFVHRERFAPMDTTALEFRTDGNVADSAWTVSDGSLGPVGGGATRHALFGDPDWFHVTITTLMTPAAGQRMGVGVGCPASGIGAGLFACVDASGATERLVILERRATGGYDERASAELPASAEGRVMVLRAFDDKLRAEIGEVSVEADRGALREGRLCLMAGPGCRFGNLDVRGLTLFEFAVMPSRYTGFDAHIQSWDGTLQALAPDDMGAGTTQTTLAALWSTTSADVARVMAPDATPLDREALFSRWATELGLALRTTPERTCFARFAEGADPGMIVLETPEPLDFTKEITVTLARVTYRAVKPTLPSRFDPDLQLEFARSFADTRFYEGLKVENARSGGDKKVLRQPERFLSKLALANEADDDMAGARTARTTLELVDMTPGGMATLRTLKAAKTKAAETTVSMTDLIKRPKIGDHVVFDPNVPETGVLLERVETEIAVRVMQNGNADKALIIPVDGAGNATELQAGQYLLRFQMERRRWETTGPADALNTYAKETSVSFEI